MFKFTELPDWCLTGTRPAFYDTESATAVEQTAKLYGVIKTLIKETETAVNKINQACEDFKAGIIKDQECFKAHIDKIMHDYIAMLDEKVKLQDKRIDETIVYIKENLFTAIRDLVSEMKETGELSEVVLSAISNVESVVNELVSRVDELTEDVSDINTSIESLVNSINQTNGNLTDFQSLINGKITELENSKPSYSYNEGTKELIINMERADLNE